MRARGCENTDLLTGNAAEFCFGFVLHPCALPRERATSHAERQSEEKPRLRQVKVKLSSPCSCIISEGKYKDWPAQRLVIYRVLS